MDKRLYDRLPEKMREMITELMEPALNYGGYVGIQEEQVQKLQDAYAEFFVSAPTFDQASLGPAREGWTDRSL